MSDERAMSNPYPWPTDPPPERAILLDLIEHLRAWERSQRTDPVHNPDYLAWMADRAEVRLREVSDE